MPPERDEDQTVEAKPKPRTQPAEDATLEPLTKAPSLRGNAIDESTAKMAPPLKDPKVVAALAAHADDPTVTVTAQVKVKPLEPEVEDVPTVSTQMDVQKAFAAEELVFPRSSPVLAPIEDIPERERTLPLAKLPKVPPAPPSSRPSLPPPSDPILVPTTQSTADEAFEPLPGPPRRRMGKVVFGVLGVCGVVLVGALAKQLIAGGPSGDASPTKAAPTATASATASASATVAASATASAAPEPPPPPPPPASSPVVATPPPPPAPAPPAPVAVTPPRRPKPAAPAPAPKPAATGKKAIVRDAPF